MRTFRNLALLLSMFSLAGCRNKYVAPEAPMPPNTILLSQMMRELSAQPGFTEAFLKDLQSGPGKHGAAL